MGAWMLYVGLDRIHRGRNLMVHVDECKSRWGTFRSNLYFGMRENKPHSLLTGLMWLGMDRANSTIRHVCEISDGLSRWGWVEHDGRAYGKELIEDRWNNMNMTIEVSILQSEDSSLRKGARSWMNSIRIAPINHRISSKSSLMFYIGYNGNSCVFNSTFKDGVSLITGTTSDQLSFRMTLVSSEKEAPLKPRVYGDAITPDCIWDMHSTF